MRKPTPERRRQARFAIASDVDLTSGDNFYVGRTRDLSIGGLYIETNASLPLGSKLAVRVKIRGKAFSIDAEVVWTLLPEGDAVGGIGLRFLELPVDARRAIERFMAVRPPLAFDLGAPSAAPPPRAPPSAPPPPRGPPPLPQGPPPLPAE
jgi:uncharacterized protein (TIGR02266 family)